MLFISYKAVKLSVYYLRTFDVEHTLRYQGTSRLMFQEYEHAEITREGMILIDVCLLKSLRVARLIIPRA